MNSFDQLRVHIQNSIKGNGNREITGFLLQDVLLSMVDILGDSITSNYEDSLLKSMWYFDSDGNLCTEKQVIIKNNLINEGDTSSGGEGEDNPVGLDEQAVLDLLEREGYITEDDIAGLMPEVDLSDYYTTTQVDDLLSKKANTQDVYTKEELNPYKAWWDKLMAHITVDENGNVVIDPNLMVVGDVASGDDGEDVVIGGVQAISINGGNPIYPNEQGIIELNDIGGGDLDLDTLATYLSNNKYINADNLDTYGVATKSWVGENYLSKSGGTIDGTSVDPLTINSTASSVGIRLRINGANKAYVGYGGTSAGTYIYNYDCGYYIGIREGEAYFNNGAYNTLIHSGNIGSQSVASAKSLITSDGTTYVSYNNTYGQVLVKGITIGYGNNTIETASGGVLKIQSNSTGGTIISQYGGNVLIGTATDDASHKVQVDGALKVYETSQRRLYTRINSAGVQCGVNTSLYTGGWNGGVTVGADNSSIGFVAGAYLEGGTLSKLFYGGTSQANASIVINGLGGNVGIGTISPQYKLDVNGGIKGLSAILGDTTNQLKISSTGALYNTSTTGGWHRRFGISVNDTAKFGIGAYGNGETLNYGYIGDSYSSPWIKITKSATTINGNLVVQGDVASA